MMENKKTGYLIVTLLGLIVIILTASDVWQGFKFRAVALQTDGTITGERERMGGKKTIYKYFVSYSSSDGAKDTAYVYTKDPFLKDGEKLQIWFDPSYPKFGRLDVSLSNSYLGIIIGFVMLGWGLPNYLREVKKEKSHKQT
jgi:hypothetical protein